MQQIESKHTLALSLDFDGCIFGSNFRRSVRNKFPTLCFNSDIDNKTSDELVITANQGLFDSLIRQIQRQQYGKVIFLIGSNRQDRRIDENMAQRIHSGSCFTALIAIADYFRAQLPNTQIIVEKILVPDLIYKLDIGSTFNAATTRIARYLPRQPSHHTKMDGFKVSLIYALLHYLANKYPDEQIIFRHYDDLEDILDCLRLIPASHIPQQMSLQILSYTGGHTPPDLRHFIEKGCQPANPNYIDFFLMLRNEIIKIDRDMNNDKGNWRKRNQLIQNLFLAKSSASLITCYAASISAFLTSKATAKCDAVYKEIFSASLPAKVKKECDSDYIEKVYANSSASLITCYAASISAFLTSKATAKCDSKYIETATVYASLPAKVTAKCDAVYTEIFSASLPAKVTEKCDSKYIETATVYASLPAKVTAKCDAVYKEIFSASLPAKVTAKTEKCDSKYIETAKVYASLQAKVKRECDSAYGVRLSAVKSNRSQLLPAKLGFGLIGFGGLGIGAGIYAALCLPLILVPPVASAALVLLAVGAYLLYRANQQRRQNLSVQLYRPTITRSDGNSNDAHTPNKVISHRTKSSAKTAIAPSLASPRQ